LRANLHLSRDLKIKQFLFFELPDRRAVRAFHVVIENLKLRFRINARFVREAEDFCSIDNRPCR
jgi:hypothetical protein